MQPPPKRELDSDSDDDPDYVPPADEPTPGRRRAVTVPNSSLPAVSEEDEATKKSAREALWADFKASLSTPTAAPVEQQPGKMVKVEKRFRFAGEDVTEVVEVPADSADATKWPRWQPPADAGPSQALPTLPASEPAEASAPSSSAEPGPSTSAPAPPKPAKRPGPRKPKTQLAPLPGAAGAKAKALTTLDKSARDWRAHVEGAPPEAGLRDELAAHRRGGGFLEKVEFLQRVELRREEAREAGRAAKRRKTIA